MKRRFSFERGREARLNPLRIAAVAGGAPVFVVAAFLLAGPLAAYVAVGLEVVAFVVVRRGRIPRRASIGASPAHAVTQLTGREESDAIADGIADRRDLVLFVMREVARAERHRHNLSMTVLRIEDASTMDAELLAVADAHMAATLSRITRASDYLGRLEPGQFGIVLELCDLEHAMEFGQRAVLAVGNRPAVAPDGESFPVRVVMSAAQYDTHRHYGAVDFVRAAETITDGGNGSGIRQATVGNDLRRRVLGDAVTRQSDRLVASRRAG